MRSEATTVQEYLDSLAEDRREAVQKLRETILQHLPAGFEEVMSYGMIGYVVPLEIYPDGYHCSPGTPLPFINLASQKNYIALYHMGIYANKELYDWFTEAYAEQVSTKLDMGKSCIRFKKTDQIPFELIGKLCSRIGPEQWIETYEKAIRR